MTDVQAENKLDSFDEIRADRACIGCGFNLFAQPVTKEPHYDLAITRCPECGTVAALQVYPAMTHWVNRFRALIAAIWIVVLLTLYVGNTMSFMGMSKGASNIAAENMSGEIGYANHLWEEAKLATQPVAAPATSSIPGLPAGTTITTSNGITTINGIPITTSPSATGGVSTNPSQYTWTVLDNQWREDHLDEIIESKGGLIANIDRKFLVMLVPGTIVAMMFGIFWSVTLLGTSRRKILILPVVACSVAFVIAIAVSVPDRSWAYASQIGEALYTPIIAPLYLGYLCLVMFVGIWLGRMIARKIIVMALPPRSRVPFGILWTRDGLELPSPK